MADGDPLSALAPLLRVRPELQEVCRFAAPWAATHTAHALGWAQFHIVTRGSCHVELPDGERYRLVEGSVLLLPQGDAHVVRSARRGAGVPIRTEAGEPLMRKTNTDGPGDAELICGRLRFDAVPGGMIVAALPKAMVLNLRPAGQLGRLRLLVQMIEEELAAAGAGAAAVATDLASALFVLMLRAHFEQAATSGGLIQLLAVPAPARAVNAMLDDPAHGWTLDELAGIAHVSRATLVRLFRKVAGLAPLAFLAELRLGLARHRLTASKATLIQVAVAVGYDSESAFARAFKRRYGISPGKLRDAAG